MRPNRYVAALYALVVFMYSELTFGWQPLRNRYFMGQHWRSGNHMAISTDDQQGKSLDDVILRKVDKWAW